MEEQKYICQDIGEIKSISLNDEIICSSKVIFATVQSEKEETIDIQMVRELHPELYGEFDQLWEKVEKKREKEMVGAKVKIRQYDNCSYTIALQEC